MTYLLILLVMGLAAWPYYHRFKSFEVHWNPIPLAMLHAAPLGFGVAAVLSYVNREGSFQHIFSFDLITGTTFWIMALALTVWNSYLTFTSETYTAPDDFETAVVAACFVCVLAFLISFPSAYLIVTAVRGFS